MTLRKRIFHKSKEMSENNMLLSFNSSFSITKDVINRAVNNGKSLLAEQKTSITESNMLLESAQTLHRFANQFLTNIRNYNTFRDNSTLNQMTNTNTNVETTLNTLHNILDKNGSSKTVSMSKVFTSLAPIVPTLIFFSIEKFKHSPKVNSIPESSNNEKMSDYDLHDMYWFFNNM